MIQKSAYVCYYCGAYFVAEFEFLADDNEPERKFFCPQCSDEMSNIMECCGSPVPILNSSNIKSFDYCASCGSSIKIDKKCHDDDLKRLKEERELMTTKRIRKARALEEYERLWEQEQKRKK